MHRRTNYLLIKALAEEVRSSLYEHLDCEIILKTSYNWDQSVLWPELVLVKNRYDRDGRAYDDYTRMWVGFDGDEVWVESFLCTVVARFPLGSPDLVSKLTAAAVDEYNRCPS